MSGKSHFKSDTRSMNFNVGSLTPLQLSKTFKIPIDDVMLQDEDGNIIFADAETFAKPLVADKVYKVMDNSKDNQQISVKASMALMPSKKQKKEIIQNLINHQVVKSLNEPAKSLSNLIPACACIEYLLVTAATALDYSLISSSVEEFMYLNNPKSMKVSVTQVAQEMSQLILKNKSELDFINSKMGFVSQQFKYILPAIWSKNSDMVTSTATQMSDATKVCVKKSTDCADRCERVVNVIKELLKGLIGAQSDKECRNEELRQSLDKLGEQIKLVQTKHDRRKKDLDEQQKNFDTAWAEHRKQQKRQGSMGKNFGAAMLDFMSFNKARAREGMDTAYKNATDNKKEEKDMLLQFHKEFSKVEDELIDLKISCKKDKAEKEGLQGIIESIRETIKRIENLDITAQNMQQYFQSISNLIKVTFQENANLFIEHAKKENIGELEIKQMMEAVVNVYAITSVVQNFATIYSIAASSKGVQSRLARGTSYLGLTHNEAQNKQRELNLEETEDETNELKSIIEKELQKQVIHSNENIAGFIDSCIQTAKSIGN